VGLLPEQIAIDEAKAVDGRRQHDARQRTATQFLPLPSNVTAFESSMRFVTGQVNLVAIVGPSGWGKSRLLGSTAHQLAHAEHLPINAVSALDWYQNPTPAESSRPLLLDDAQEVFLRSKCRQRLRQVLERRVQGGRPTMLAFTSPRISRAIRNFLPLESQWTIAEMSEPTSCEREVIVRNLADNLKLVLDDSLVRFIARRVGGNGRSIYGALLRLKLVDEEWLGADRVINAIGILHTHLAQEDGWDVRDSIFEAVRHSKSAALADKQGLCCEMECAVYFMLKRFRLCEKEVASYFDLAPGAAYAMATTVSRRCKRLGGQETIERCLDEITRSFDQF